MKSESQNKPTTNGPAFRDFMRSLRTITQLSVRELSDKIDIPSGTVATLLHRNTAIARPRPPIVKAIATAFDLPLLSVAACAGYFERTEVGQAEQAVIAAMEYSGRDLLSNTDRSAKFSHRGIKYLYQAVMGSVPYTEVNLMAWSKNWNLNPNEEELNLMFSTGELPQKWRIRSNMRWFDQLPSPWLWSWFYTIGPFGGDTYSLRESLIDTVGILFLMGRIGPSAVQGWECQNDYQFLQAAYKHHIINSLSDFKSYRAAIQKITWTSGTIESLSNDDQHKSLSTPTAEQDNRAENDQKQKQMQYIQQQWTQLTPRQRNAVIELIRSIREG